MTDIAYRRVLARIWAKSARGGAIEGESLLDHTAAVVGRLADLHRLFPGLAARTGDPRLWHRAFWACVMHDLGKVASGFQAQLAPGAPPWGHRHEVLSLAFLEWVLPDDEDGDRAWIAAGIASHHRDLADIARLYPPADDPKDDPVVRVVAEAGDGDVAALAAWLVTEPPVWAAQHGLLEVDAQPAPPASPVVDFRRHAAARVHRALAAYRRLVRELGEQDASSSPNRAALALRGLVLLADHTASAHAPTARAALAGVQEVVTRLGLGALDSLYTHQRGATRTSGNALLTALTGSGKTEAALLWAGRQHEERPGRLFYLLPYQASLNAMHDRLGRMFPGCVGLQHSRALQALYRWLLDKPYGAREAGVVARREHALARLHHYPIRVLTPYQLLRGAFRLKGYEATFTDAVDGIFVFDEIHAYEPRRFGMFLGMIDYLGRRFGGRFLVMSATLPRVLRDALEGVFDRPSIVDGGPDLYRSFARHTVRVVEGSIGDIAVVEQIRQRAVAGDSVLVVCNTVRRATRLWEMVKERLVGPGAIVELLHGRFNARDRFRKERRLLEEMGTKSRKPGSIPSVLVPTQVVELSLDIDFDTIYSEPAPLESLVQRFGRVNRGRRRASCDVHVMRQPGEGRDVYESDYMTPAVDVLAAHAGKILDEAQVASWLDGIYAGSRAERWRREVQRSRKEFEAVCLADLRAFQSSPELADAFDRMFDGTEVLPRDLASEYARLAEEEPLQTVELLVPISHAQLAHLQRTGRVTRQDGLAVVEAPYDAEQGLDLSRTEAA